MYVCSPLVHKSQLTQIGLLFIISGISQFVENQCGKFNSIYNLTKIRNNLQEDHYIYIYENISQIAACNISDKIFMENEDTF